MLIRYLKIDLALFVAAFCLFYATQNVVNLQAAYGFVGYMMSMPGHEAYPAHFGPPVTNSILVWIAVSIIIALEYTAGLLAAKGGWDLWKARKASSDEFQAAKKNVIAAAGLGLIIWFGIFHAFGGAYFQMWQIEAGEGPLMNAFWFAASLGIIALYVNMRDSEV